MMVREDLGVLYAKSMEHFGCGTAMFQPISSEDIAPPCVGYIDGNGTWNLIERIGWSEAEGMPERHPGDLIQSASGRVFRLLERMPRKTETVNIEWRPRTSIGVRQWTVDASGQTPIAGFPVAADAHIKYKSNTNFGAVLIAQKPVTLISYNDETLFKSWLAANKARLSSLYGAELRRYGLRIITRTYTSPGCSINAWESKHKEANISMKAKASMLGELGEDLDWTEKLTDKDWSHYVAKEKGQTVVLFFDGIEIPSREWWWEGIKGRFGRADASRQSRCGSPPSRRHGTKRRPISSRSPRDMTRDLASDDEEKDLQLEDLWGSLTPLHKPSPPISRNTSRRRHPSTNRPASLTRSLSTPKRSSRHSDDEYQYRSPARDGHAVHFSPHPSVRITAPDSPTRRLSTASTATSSSSIRRHEPKVTNAETGLHALGPKSALQRKPAPLSLRHTG